MSRQTRGYGFLLPIGILTFGGYFVFAAIQGEGGLLRRIELEAERTELRAELAMLDARVAALRDRTRRLSDDYLDLDLLDERARDILGLVRADEIVVE
ncbi:FtsB family cell division protein [Jannaschia aquimarina]|uniref:Septum formation initiator n=1 Tax=Jannaschia aquimarina TaxID=935700 RepID=A0A0D1ENT1_9RHOB|nr:septum formation initiator family protein [Jannaschia aquimarina]KIT17305.1 Septum formation initiator [Jannaschia aquimarina]SNT19981.1 Cell division protein FtsB [Jannaschia aquimarina]